MTFQKARSKQRPVARSIKIGGIYYDHQEPRRNFVLVPSIRMRGYWMSRAGFVVSEKVDILISKNSITLKTRKKPTSD